NVIVIEAVDITKIDEINDAITDKKENSLQYAIFNASIARYISNNYQQDLRQAIDQISATFVANNGEVSLYTKSAVFSIQALLEGMQSEVNHLESLHSDLSLSAITEFVDRELDELNIKDTNLPKPEIKEIIKEVEKEVIKEVEKEIIKEVDKEIFVYLPIPSEVEPKEETTHSFFYGLLENTILSELDNAKEFVKSLRTIGYTLEENAKTLSNRIIEGLGGEIDVETVTDDFLDYVDIAKKSYPHVAAVTLAMIQMAEAEQDYLEYDLGEDKDSYLPEELKISGIVKKTTQWGSVYLTLQDSEIEGLGKVDLRLRLWQSYYCYYCYGYEYADVDVTVDGKYGKIHLQDWGTRIDRSYNYYARERVPNSISLDDANIAITFSKEGSNRSITVSGETDAYLYWPGAYYATNRLLPQLQRVSIAGQFYNWQSDVSYFNGRLSYYNYDYYYRTDDPVDWTKQHAENFSVEASFSARVKVPDPMLPTYAQYKHVNLSAGFRNGYTERKWLGFNYDGEAIRIEQSSTDYDYEKRYRFSNRAGAIVDALVNTDSREVLSSKVTVNGQSVAKIESSDMGPIIRYSDGTFESF
ncbi:MAG: hypothetical protein OEX19_07060, partial [Gammaproteobacteria bacterium]|nr:hypothetical protein [Gammaproteobacteria bacterium]